MLWKSYLLQYENNVDILNEMFQYSEGICKNESMETDILNSFTNWDWRFCFTLLHNNKRIRRRRARALLRALGNYAINNKSVFIPTDFLKEFLLARFQFKYQDFKFPYYYLKDQKNVVSNRHPNDKLWLLRKDTSE